MIDLLQEILKIYIHIVIPAMAGITFFALAKFVRHIMPLRALVSSPEAYDSAFWSLLFFGVYIGLKPVQVLAGPHPWPLILSSVREFVLIALVGPITFISLMYLCLGPEKFSKRWVIPVLVVGVLMGAAFCYANARVIQGSREIVKLGMLTAYDGLWFKSREVGIQKLLHVMFLIRLVNPGCLLFAGGATILYHAAKYPADKRELYDNMPRKLYILAAAVLTYSLTLIIASLRYGAVPEQWMFYSVGALVAGILEAISLSMPVRSDVQVSEHE